MRALHDIKTDQAKERNFSIQNCLFSSFDEKFRSITLPPNTLRNLLQVFTLLYCKAGEGLFPWASPMLFWAYSLWTMTLVLGEHPGPCLLWFFLVYLEGMLPSAFFPLLFGGCFKEWNPTLIWSVFHFLKYPPINFFFLHVTTEVSHQVSLENKENWSGFLWWVKPKVVKPLALSFSLHRMWPRGGVFSTT